MCSQLVNALIPSVAEEELDPKTTGAQVLAEGVATAALCALRASKRCVTERFRQRFSVLADDLIAALPQAWRGIETWTLVGTSVSALSGCETV